MINKKVMVFGTFDIIHPGHLHMFKEAKEYGDFLIIIIARDKTVCDVKTKKPLNNEKVRLKNIQKLNIGNEVCLGCVGDKYQSVREQNPDVIALGYDQKVFVDNLSDAIPSTTQIVRLQPFMPEVYKSSILKQNE